MPIYETKQDLIHRDQVLRALEALAPGMKVVPEDGLRPINGWLKNGERYVRGIEVRRRVDSYGMGLRPISDDGVMIDVQKIVRGLRLSASRGAKLTLAFDLVDGLWTVTLDKAPDWPIGDGGRTDRNDPNDNDRCYFAPTGAFQRVGPSVTR